MDFLVESAKNSLNESGLDGLALGQANIKMICFTGAGNNLVAWLYKRGIKGAEIVAVNTDSQHLKISEADKKFIIGKEATRGLGCGGVPPKSAEAAQEPINEL